MNKQIEALEKRVKELEDEITKLKLQPLQQNHHHYHYAPVPAYAPMPQPYMAPNYPIVTICNDGNQLNAAANAGAGNYLVYFGNT